MPWDEHEYAPPSGKLLKLRREDIGLSQAVLAWAARVSRNTVGNLERSQGEPEERVFKNVCAALGVKSQWKFSFAEEDVESHVLFSAGAVKRLYEIVTEDIQPRSSKRAREAIDVFRNLVETEDKGLFERSELQMQTTRLANYIAPSFFDSPGDRELSEAFIERGWSPEDSQDLNTADMSASMRDEMRLRSIREREPSAEVQELRDEVQTLQQRLDSITSAAESLSSLAGASPREAFNFRSLMQEREAFRLLPVRVQEALLSGRVLDSEVTAPPNTNGFSMVNLIVRHDSAQDDSLNAEDRRALINSLHVWHLALVFAGHGFAVMQEHKWMAPEEVERRIKDALSVITESKETGLAKPPSSGELEEQ
ncbi:transcriptional regulator [Nonomuraea sp. NPDC026600]|uniref:helix-turn-helix domain-containing protein n=1 Tax=Nonomuraea sp. NPDC026600 TaxID=3155363 RepID=UPI003401AC61